ncbi:MAG: hypothetical protein MJ096_01440 [Clostridia bacterium]|nr:hypothetical protein [Clostridia bacterium]
METDVTETTYNGIYAGGAGRNDWLKLIDDSFSMLHPTSRLPYLQMLYNPETETFKEGFIWGNGFWMQNSYGFAYGAMPFLSKKWRRVLQNSLDLFWDRLGDGKRIGADDGVPNGLACRHLCAPDGALGDCVIDGGIVYKQGDGPFELYDWFYEATACGILLECDLLLFNRDLTEIEKYIDLLLRAADHIEKTRAENGLFLVGASANLLAPSYGGSFDEKTKTPGKAYLTGLAVTYGAAMKKLAEVSELGGDRKLRDRCLEKYERTYAALPQLLTEEGYLAKSMDPDGTLHGVYGAEKHGYLEAVCNVDAIAHSMVDEETVKTIYNKIASVEGIRPAGILCNNYPSLDDSLFRYLDLDDLRTSYIHKPGNWVDGGCWSTVEGRAIIAYLEAGAADDAFRAADYYMKWAADYRQDQPMSQWGHNTCNPWQEENGADDGHEKIGRPVGVMIDNFATATCLGRGLLSYIPTAVGLTVRVNIPKDITEYVQHQTVNYAGGEINFRVANGDHEPVLFVNGIKIRGTTVPASILNDVNDVLIDMRGEGYKWHDVEPEKAYKADVSVLPRDLIDIYERFSEGKDEFSKTVCDMVHAAAERRELPFDAENFRPMTPDKKEEILKLYDDAVRSAAGIK